MILAIDHAVDGVCRQTGVEGENFCGASRRCQEHYGALQLAPHAHHGRNQRGLTRTGIASQHKRLIVARIGQETADGAHGLTLMRRELVRKLGRNALFEKRTDRHTADSGLRKNEKLTEP